MKQSTTETQIDSLSALTACVGSTPGPRDLKVIDHLDEHALRWISNATCLFISLATKSEAKIRALIAGGKPGFVRGDTEQMIIPMESIDNPESIAIGDGWGSLFVIPSLKESLRVNGRVSALTNSSITIDVDECYLHCAKAFLRSKIWEEYNAPEPVETEDDFCLHSSFLLVATCDHQLNADISPKGDPAGSLLKIKDHVAWYADRPGNRRVDGFRNLLNQPKTEMLALIPGSSQVLRISGETKLFSEHPYKEDFRVNNKLPHLLVGTKITGISLEVSQALAKANLWPPVPPNERIKAAEIWKAHMQASKIHGLQAKIAKAAISVPGALEKVLDWDSKNNLY